MTKATELSKADARVLAQIFDPENFSSSPVKIIDDVPISPNSGSESLSHVEASQRSAINQVEKIIQQGDSAGENAKDAAFTEAYEILSTCITENPTYAAPYNNRAQLIRWRYGDSIFTAASTDPTAIWNNSNLAEVVLGDLATAIRLATPASPSSPVPRSQAVLLAQAHTQRAAILYASSKALRKETSTADAATVSVPLRAFGATPDDLEAAGAKDFFLGGKYGNEISRAMAVHTNPYAKICGNIVKEAMRKEMGQISKQETNTAL